MGVGGRARWGGRPSALTGGRGKLSSFFERGEEKSKEACCGCRGALDGKRGRSGVMLGIGRARRFLAKVVKTIEGDKGPLWEKGRNFFYGPTKDRRGEKGLADWKPRLRGAKKLPDRRRDRKGIGKKEKRAAREGERERAAIGGKVPLKGGGRSLTGK